MVVISNYCSPTPKKKKKKKHNTNEQNVASPRVALPSQDRF